MSEALNVLHLTAHLGGGVGKALSGIILSTPADAGIRHEIVCLEIPEKSQFVDKLSDAGCPVTINPSPEALAERIEAADIVQLEWWGHPAIPAALCRGPLPPMRLLVWCHVSGIHTPIFPERLLNEAHGVIFTSPCSYAAQEVARLSSRARNNTGVIHSSGGFSGLAVPERAPDAPLAAGYLGSLNFAKLHPCFVDFLAAVTVPGFSVSMIGDTTNQDVLQNQCRQAGRPELLAFRGYRTDIAGELAAINVFPYLLNPRHYGTSENALLEAMAMGVVPVVLDNPAERSLVADHETGLIVQTRDDFAAAISWLNRNPQERQRLSCQVAATVRKRFDVSHTIAEFSRYYTAITDADPTEFPFLSILGHTPAEWFLANQRYPEFFTKYQHPGTIDELTLPGLLEKTKGSVFHYRNYFPDDERLARWAQTLEAYIQRTHETRM